MRLNQKGFSLIELMAVLVISSVILVPLLISFTDSIKINQRSQTSRIAASIAEAASQALEKIDFSKYRAALTAENDALNYYLELDYLDCDDTNILIVPNDQLICQSIFSLESSSRSFDETQFQVFMFDYSLTDSEMLQLTGPSSTLPASVINELENNDDIQLAMNGTDTQDLIWVIIWIDYFDEPDLYIVVTGLMANDDLA